MNGHYEDGQTVRLRETGEETRIIQWALTRGPGKQCRYTYTIEGHEGTFFFHDEIDPIEQTHDQ